MWYYPEDCISDEFRQDKYTKESTQRLKQEKTKIIDSQLNKMGGWLLIKTLSKELSSSMAEGH